MGKITTYVNSVFTEIKAIHWPSRKTVINDTLIVLVSLLLSGVIIGLLDFGLSTLFKIGLEKIG